MLHAGFPVFISIFNYMNFLSVRTPPPPGLCEFDGGNIKLLVNFELPTVSFSVFHHVVVAILLVSTSCRNEEIEVNSIVGSRW